MKQASFIRLVKWQTGVFAFLFVELMLAWAGYGIAIARGRDPKLFGMMAALVAAPFAVMVARRVAGHVAGRLRDIDQSR